MSELHRTGRNPALTDPVYERLSDAELTERARGGTPGAHPATRELRRRHLPAVVAYARLFGRDQVAGNQLAARAFALAGQEAHRGIDPQGPRRHHLLTLVHRVALDWAAGARRGRLAPEFTDWATGSDGGGDEPTVRPDEPPTMLSAFHSLPERTQGVLWYAVVEEEPEAGVATLVGVEPGDLPDLGHRAREAMRGAYLRTYLERHGDRSCLGFQRIIDAAARPEDPRRSTDLERHLTECPSCARVLAELVAMAESPRTVLAEGLLRWGAAAYVATSSARPPLPGEERPEPAGSAPRPPLTPPSGAGSGPPPPHRRARTSSRRSLALAAAGTAAGAAVTALLVAASGDADPAGHKADVPPAATVTATVSGTPPPPGATPSPSPTGSSPAPTASRSGTPPVPGPEPGVLGPTYTEVINGASGLCLDVEHRDLEKGTDAVVARCDGAPEQQWRVDSLGLVRNFADPGFCLDSRGRTDRDAGVWECSAADGDNGANLVFVVDLKGAIRPLIDSHFALTPDSGRPGGPVGFRPARDRVDQRWIAGSSPSG